MLTKFGKPSSHFSPIVGVITRGEHPFYDRSRFVKITSKLDVHSIGYKACITENSRGKFYHPDHIYSLDGIDGLNEGDIVSILNNGAVNVIWEKDSFSNCLFLTDSCNCSCLMCPQPPKKHDPYLVKQAELILDLLKGKKQETICITGGEPTLLNDSFIKILDRCVREHPESEIQILTNGKKFSDMEFTRTVAAVSNKKVCFCVSMHSDIDIIHDEIVGAKHSYECTQKGIYNLASCGAAIEIRIAISKLNCKRLVPFAEHLYAYFPFCQHYAFMGLELHGHAATNKDCVAIRPLDYKCELTEAILYLARRAMPVSVYNIPLCMCDPKIQKFARQSISGWKNVFHNKCSGCKALKDCAGFFSTSEEIPEEHIRPIV